MKRMDRKPPALGILMVLLAVVALTIVSCGTREPELIPRDVLFGNPEKVRTRISPDGERIAYVAPLDGVLNVWVKTLGENDDRAVTSDDNRGIFRYFWAEDGKYIMYLQDADGDENWLLYAVTLETGETRNLTPYIGVQVRILDHSKHVPNTLIILMNRQDPRLHDAYRLDLTTGDMELVARNPGNIVGWITDSELRVRGAMAATPDGGFDLLLRETEDESWRTALTWTSEDNLTSGVMGFTKDGKSLYMMDSRNENTGRLVVMDIESGYIEVIAEDPTYDVSDVMVNPDTFEIEAVCFTREREEWTVLDDAVNDDFDAIRKLTCGEFSVNSRDHADDTWLVSFVRDSGPVSYYIYDRESKTGTFLFDHRPELNDYTLLAMEPISFTSRDGLTIRGYITYPAGKDRTNLPMVLGVHGGPWYRDTWGYNPEAQWMANRGYVFLQVNFRGSTGYGKEFLNAGDKEWGGKMHDDLVDAVNWAVEQGIADPERVAIYGASYGGYAALVGATFTPDLFCCAIPMMGPSNLMTFITSVPPYWTTMLEMFYERIGNPETEEEFLRSRSPLFRVDQVKIPMLIAQGANDPRVKQAESDQFVEAMREKGLEVEYIVFEDEGHGFAKAENRLKFFGDAERFLAKHLGGRCEGPVEETASADE